MDGTLGQGCYAGPEFRPPARKAGGPTNVGAPGPPHSKRLP